MKPKDMLRQKLRNITPKPVNHNLKPKTAIMNIPTRFKISRVNQAKGIYKTCNKTLRFFNPLFIGLVTLISHG